MQCHSYRRKVYTPLVSRTSCRVEPVRVCNITKVMLYFLRVVGLFLRFMLTIVLLSRPYQNPDYRQSKKKRDSGRLPNTAISRNPFISRLFHPFITLLLTEKNYRLNMARHDRKYVIPRGCTLFDDNYDIAHFIVPTQSLR